MKKEIIIPAAGESVTEADIVDWYKENGEFVEMDEPLVELETDKASMDLTAESSGILTISVTDGTVQVGDIIGHIEEGAAKKVTKAEPKVSTESENKNESITHTMNAPLKTNSHVAGHPSPAAEKLMKEKNISAEHVNGTGKDGRIIKEDILKAPAPQPEKKVDKKSIAQPEVKSTIDPTKRKIRHEKMSRLRKTLMHRLVEAQQTTASLTTFNEIDMKAVIELRKSYKDKFKEKYNIGLGFMSFFTKAVTMALMNFPIINATIEGEEIAYHDYCDIGIAVATPKGLIVPVIKNAESLTFQEIESAIRSYALKGRDGKITLEDMSGGTFSITNGGTFGSMLSTPILNRPQSAIMGMHNIVERPTAVNGQVEIRPIMYVALTYDHRLIDGSDAVQFLVNVKELLEDPARLLLGV